MDTMMTPKEALVKDGTIPVKVGRGRLSREADERCKWLVENKGWNIKGYSLSTAAPTSAAEPVVKKVAQNGEKVISDFVIFWPETEYKAVDANKKEWGMREVCNTCMVSLVQNHCENPTILGDIAVTIVAK